MKEKNREFIDKIRRSIGNRTDRSKETDSCPGVSGTQDEMDLRSELEKRFRELFGEGE